MSGEKLSLEQFSTLLENIDSGLGLAASQLWKEGVNTEALLRKLTKQDMHMAGINLGNRVLIYNHFHPTDAGFNASSPPTPAAIGAAVAEHLQPLLQGTSSHEPHDMRQMQMQLAELRVQLNTTSQTTQTAQDLGAVWIKRAQTRELSCLRRLTEVSLAVQTVYSAVLDSFSGRLYAIPIESAQDPYRKRKRGEHTKLILLSPSQATSVTLANMIPQSFQESFKEEEHMQPVLIDLLQTALLAANGDCILLDTQKSNNQLHGPIARPDCISVASGLKPLWTQVVSLFEFKIGDSKTEIETMFGQQIERCRHVLHNNKDRNMVLAINITMNTLEIMMVERQAHEDLKVTRTGLQPFSISPESPGFQLLVQWLLTPKSDLGFVMTHLPAFSKLGSCSFAVEDLIKQGSAHHGSGSWVFAAIVASDADAILKLNTAPTEGDLLSQLQGVDRVIRLLGKGTCLYAGKYWHCIIVSPFCQPLNCDDSVKLFAQVVYDVASAIGGSAEKDIAHRDVTPINFGHSVGRGYLFDFSAGKDMASNGWRRPRSANSLSSITGTVLWAPLAVLEGEQHSESSMLEGLFISSLSISCNGKLAGRHAMRPSQLKHCARLRRGQLTRLELDEFPNIEPHLKPLILPLHDLFYPKALPQGFPLKARTYNTEVTTQMVQELCKSVSPDLVV